MAVVAHSATPDKTDKVELEFWQINGDSGENSRMKVHNVVADSTAGLQYERSVFSERAGNWPDLRGLSESRLLETFLCQWCHGAPGVGLARLGGIGIVTDGATRTEVSAALKTTVKSPMSAFDHLCCGTFGIIDVLLTAGIRLKREALISLAHERCSIVLQRATRRGSFGFPVANDSHNPGFFTGISGIGYQLLRLSSPETHASVLLWE